MLFGWSISKNFNTNNISNEIKINPENPKIKLFENEKSRTLRVAVLNGCGERGIGDQFSSFLNNNYGLIITRTENAKDEEGENKFDYESTKVIIINENNSNNNLSKKELLNLSRERDKLISCLLYTSPSPRDKRQSRMPSSA